MLMLFLFIFIFNFYFIALVRWCVEPNKQAGVSGRAASKYEDFYELLEKKSFMAPFSGSFMMAEPVFAIVHGPMAKAEAEQM
jgi:hypothetical protein